MAPDRDERQGRNGGHDQQVQCHPPPRYMGRWWFERAIADFGQSMGMTASCLLLLRVSDPASQSPAMASFGYKQLLFEAVVGGGLFTAAAIPLIVGFGPGVMLAFAAAIMLFWVAMGLLYFGRRREPMPSSYLTEPLTKPSTAPSMAKTDVNTGALQSCLFDEHGPRNLSGRNE